MKRLVPSRELCEKIPAGNFNNAVYAWHLADVSGFVCGKSGGRTIKGQQWQLVKSSKHKLDEARAAGELIFPAPTLEEILNELHKLQEDVFLKWSETAYQAWLVNAYTAQTGKDHYAYDKKLVTAALKTYLQLKRS